MRFLRRGTSTSAASRLATAPTQALSIYWTTDTHLAPLAEADSGQQFMFSTVRAKLASLKDQINAALPHYFLLTGDAIHDDDEFAEFRTLLWDGISGSVGKIYTPGNHCYAIASDPGLNTMETIAVRMGYDADPSVAGSKFNKSLALTGNGVSVRMLVIDAFQERMGTPPGVNSEQAPVDKGSLSDAQKTWIAAQLAATNETVVLLASHVGAQDTRDSSDVWGVPADRQALVDIVNAELAARPWRKIVHLFGHVHSSTLVNYGNVPGFPGILSPCIIQANPSRFTKLYVFADGTILTDTGTVSSPYP